MTDETETTVSGWTTDTLHQHMVSQIGELARHGTCETEALRDYLNERINGLKELVSQHNELMKEAAVRADIIDAYNKEVANNWRKSFEDLRQTFVTIPVCDRIESDVRRNELGLKDAVRREDLTKIYNDIEKLRDQSNTGRGKEAANSNLITLGIAVLAVFVSLAGIFYHPQESATNYLNTAQLSALSNRVDSSQVTAQQQTTRQDLINKLDDVVKQLQLNREVQRSIAHGKDGTP